MHTRVTQLMTRWLRPRLVPAAAPLSTPLNSHLAIGLWVDAPAGARPLRADLLERWGMEREELLPIALDNLRRELSGDRWQVLDRQRGTRMLLHGNGQLAARALVLDEVLGNAPLGGCLVAVPTTESVLVQPLNGMQDLEYLDKFIAATTHLASQGGAAPLLPNALMWTDGQRFERLELSEEDGDYTLEPSRGLARSLTLISAHWRNSVPAA